MTRVVLALMWTVRLLPLPVQAAIGNVVGAALFWLIHERRHVTRVNLAKCFPDMPQAERERLARAHFRAFCRSFIERGMVWWSSMRRFERLVRLEGMEHLEALKGEPVIILAPHFVGFDFAATRLAMQVPLASMYSRQKDALLDRIMLEGRTRFGVELYPRQAGIRKALRTIKAGRRYFYLPDLDFGMSRSTVFVPFFGVPAATVTGLSYIARATGARVVPFVGRMLPGGRGYVGRLYPAWDDFPSGDDAADARRMMAFIEERVREMPEQYFWLHKRFKTRPPGEAKFY